MKKDDPLNSQPRIWANLVVIGNQDPLFIHFLAKIGVVIFIALALTGVWKYKGKRKK
ncbi:MAG: hypothetical protein HC906_12885 [Bacteroidales bacterium]|nr:hypothetical protein [Bacteroidales bacterium]